MLNPTGLAALHHPGVLRRRNTAARPQGPLLLHHHQHRHLRHRHRRRLRGQRHLRAVAAAVGGTLARGGGCRRFSAMQLPRSAMVAKCNFRPLGYGIDKATDGQIGAGVRGCGAGMQHPQKCLPCEELQCAERLCTPRAAGGLLRGHGRCRRRRFLGGRRRPRVGRRRRRRRRSQHGGCHDGMLEGGSGCFGCKGCGTIHGRGLWMWTCCVAAPLPHYLPHAYCTLFIRHVEPADTLALRAVRTR